jgi:hypothetical protein
VVYTLPCWSNFYHIFVEKKVVRYGHQIINFIGHIFTTENGDKSVTLFYHVFTTEKGDKNVNKKVDNLVTVKCGKSVIH